MVIEVAIIVQTLWRQCATYTYGLEGVGVIMQSGTSCGWGNTCIVRDNDVNIISTQWESKLAF